MKFLHLSDLHLGKRVNEYSMLEDQEYILREILRIIDEEAPDAVLIAGDVYDKSVPPTEAVELFDRFLVALSRRGQKVYVISGNHDSAERLSFGGRLMTESGIHLSPAYAGTLKPFLLEDEYGPLALYLLPFLRPAHVRRFLGEEIHSYTEAMEAVIREMAPDPAIRNILVTHQFVTGADRSESEEISIGGADNVDVSVFEPFDYVALGHLHRPQNCSSPRVRYCGTPLKYSFSESGDRKSVTVAELMEKGNLNVRTVPLQPLRDLVELKGTYDELMRKSFYEGTPYPNDYTHITLTDEEDVPDAIGKLRTVYHHLMKLDYDNTRTRKNSVIEALGEVEKKSPLTLFREFYELQNNLPLSEKQEKYMENLIETIWEEDNA